MEPHDYIEFYNNERFQKKKTTLVRLNTRAKAAYNGQDTSKRNEVMMCHRRMWPETLGLAATFDPEITKKFRMIASREYRALGLATALSPQIDIATEPLDRSQYRRVCNCKRCGAEMKLFVDYPSNLDSGFPFLTTHSENIE